MNKVLSKVKGKSRMSEHEFMLHLTVEVLLIRENKILLMKRQNTGYEDGKYSVVGGHLEAGEDFKSAIVREAKEEANITLNAEDLKLVSIVHSKGATDNYVNIFFSAHNYSGDIRNNETDKCLELKWFDIDNLPDDIIEIDKRVINNYKDNSNNYLIEFGWNN